MEKILISIKDDFQSRVYQDFFREEGFEVLTADDKNEVEDKVFQENPEVVLLDVLIAQEDDYQILKNIKENKKTSVILFSKAHEGNYREKAVEFEVKDFIVGAYNSPINILSKIKIHLGKEKSYSVNVDYFSSDIKELMNDLGYEPGEKCRKCSNNLEMVMLRDLSKGSNYFKVSFVCPQCQI